MRRRRRGISLVLGKLDWGGLVLLVYLCMGLELECIGVWMEVIGADHRTEVRMSV
jgi:hypothetical protein